MKTSEQGLQFIMDQEGCVLHSYNDQTGNSTIGVGHLIQENESFPDEISKETALMILAADVQRFENAVNGYGLELTQNQFDVLVDFSFNAGEGALAQLLNHGLDEVPNQLPRWNKSRGQILRALVNRRAAEVEIWNS